MAFGKLFRQNIEILQLYKCQIKSLAERIREEKSHKTFSHRGQRSGLALYKVTLTRNNFPAECLRKFRFRLEPVYTYNTQVASVVDLGAFGGAIRTRPEEVAGSANSSAQLYRPLSPSALLEFAFRRRRWWILFFSRAECLSARRGWKQLFFFGLASLKHEWILLIIIIVSSLAIDLEYFELWAFQKWNVLQTGITYWRLTYFWRC